MDEDLIILLEAIKRGHDALSVRVAALTALVGAMAERDPPTERQIIAWSRAIAEASGDQSQTAVHRMALDILAAVSDRLGNTNRDGET
jgi:hypothetical protein